MIYPNPLDGMVNIKMAEFKKAMIYNLLGKKVIKINNSRIDISELSEGVYIIKLGTGVGNDFRLDSLWSRYCLI